MEDKFIDEFQNLKSMYTTNFCEQILSPWNLLNNSKTSSLETLFSHLNAGLWIFFTIPAPVTNAEGSLLKKIQERFTHDHMSIQTIKLTCVGDRENTCQYGWYY